VGTLDTSAAVTLVVAHTAHNEITMITTMLIPIRCRFSFIVMKSSPFPLARSNRIETSVPARSYRTPASRLVSFYKTVPVTLMATTLLNGPQKSKEIEKRNN
jgi:hypothetical protein